MINILISHAWSNRMMKDPVFGTVIVPPHLVIFNRLISGHRLWCSLARSRLVTDVVRMSEPE